MLFDAGLRLLIVLVMWAVLLRFACVVISTLGTVSWFSFFNGREGLLLIGLNVVLKTFVFLYGFGVCR